MQWASSLALALDSQEGQKVCCLEVKLGVILGVVDESGDSL